MLHTFTGASGKQYAFNVYPAGTSFIDDGAVYIFASYNPYREYFVAYVGETGSMKDRIPGHEKWDCAKEYGADSICVLWENSLLSRLTIEQDLIEAYNPPCNKT